RFFTTAVGTCLTAIQPLCEEAAAVADESWRSALHNDLEESRAKRAARSQRPYDLAAWKVRAHAFLAEHPGCLGCGNAASIADHITPLSCGGHFDGPLQALCQPCHDTTKRRLELLYRQGRCSANDLKMDSELAQSIRI